MNGSKTFDPKIVLGLLLFGALAFVATLYFIGVGETSRGTNDGGAHAYGRGLNGYAALIQLLEEEGHEPEISRSAGNLDDEGVLIITPPAYADGDEIKALIEKRRYVGPTIVVLPKWLAYSPPTQIGSDVKEGWVVLADPIVPDWVDDLGYGIELELKDKETGWLGLGQRGQLPRPDAAMSANSTQIVPIILAENGDQLVGYLDDGDSYPVLEEAAGIQGDSDAEIDRWNVMFVFEPDLFNNYGFASEQRADIAHRIVDLAMEGEDLSITVDLTLNGLGAAQNLLTLAFSPPFLAATLCLLLAMVVVAWRAFRRFGPPVAEGRAIAFGKSRLVRNSAGFIERSKRTHLLSGPYANMLRERIMKALGLKNADDQAIDSAVARRAPQAPAFSQSFANLRNAKSPNEILRAAAALKSIERMLTQ